MKDSDVMVSMNLQEFHDLMNASPQKMHEDDRSPLDDQLEEVVKELQPGDDAVTDCIEGEQDKD